MKFLKKDIQVKRIYFISDIHIKNDSSYDHIYYKVFDNLFNFYTKDNVNENDLIVVTGDIMDNPYAISGSAIKLAKYLYINLSNFCPIINILGNHDYKANVDTITPIVKEYLNTKNKIYFLLYNKVYIYGDIAFGHTKMNSMTVTKCKKFNKKYKTIALFHGIMNGAKLENGMVCTDSRNQFTINKFKWYKYCAFGDIHKHQYLRNDKTAFYTGSLIAQKRSEDGFEHGTIRLDIEKDTIDFIEIPNEHKTLNLVIDNDGNVSNYDLNKIINTSKYLDLQLSFGSYNEKHIKNIKSQIENKGIVITNFINKPMTNLISFDTQVKVDDKELKLSQNNDKNSFTNFLLIYTKQKHKIENEKRLIKNINLLINKAQIEDLIKQKRNLQLLEIRINNIMIYGKNVCLDISKMIGIYGFCETNSSGKSTFCEIISLILFGKTPRCSNSYSFIRGNETEAECSIKLLSNGIEYEITRFYKYHSSKKDNIKTYSILQIKKQIDKTNYNIFVKENDRITNKFNTNDNIFYKDDDFLINMIETEIITYNEIYQLLVISQNREKSFLQEKDKDIMLFKIANLSYLNNIASECSKIYSGLRKTVKDNIKKFCDSMFYEDCKNMDNENKLYNYVKNKINEVEKNIEQSSKNNSEKYIGIQNKYNEMKNEIIKLKERLNIYKEFEDIDDYDFDSLNQEIDDINKEIKINKSDISKIENDIIKTNNKLQELKINLEQFANIEQDYEKFKDDQKQIINNYNKEIIKLNKNIVEITFEPITQKQYIKLKKEKESLSKQIEKLNIKLQDYNNKNNKINTITEIKKSILDYENYNVLLNKIVNLELLINFINENNTLFKKDKNTKETINNKLNDYNKELLQYKTDLDKNKILKENYGLTKLNKDYSEEIKTISSQINEYSSELNIIQQKITDYEHNKNNEIHYDKIKKYENDISIEETKKFDKYEEYLILNTELLKYDKELNVLELNKEKYTNTLAKNIEYLTNNNYIIEKINKNRNMYNKYCEIKSELETFNKEFNKIEEQYNDLNNEFNESETKNKQIINKCIVAKGIIDKHAGTLEDIDDFNILLNLLNNNGLCDKILKEQIIVKLQQSLDVICKYIGHEKINIIIENLPNNKMKKYNITINTNKIKDISNAGGFQSNIMELLFKLAFLSINNYFTSDFIIIDEIFDACSEENKSIAIKLVEYFKTQYKKILLVSHNRDIINLFDHRIIIKKDSENGNTIIQS